MDLATFTQSSHKTHCSSPRRKDVNKLKPYRIMDLRNCCFTKTFWDYKKVFRSRGKWRFLSQMAKLTFTQSKETLSAFPSLPGAALAARQVGCHTSVPFWQPQRQELTGGVWGLKSRPRDTRNLWDPSTWTTLGQPTILKVWNSQRSERHNAQSPALWQLSKLESQKKVSWELRDTGKVETTTQKTGQMELQKAVPQGQIFTPSSDTFFW